MIGTCRLRRPFQVELFLVFQHHLIQQAISSLIVIHKICPASHLRKGKQLDNDKVDTTEKFDARTVVLMCLFGSNKAVA